MTEKEKVIDYVKSYYDTTEGPEWWEEVEKVLRVDFGYPKIYYLEGTPAESMLLDFHPVFRPLIITHAPPTSATSLTKYIVAKGRSGLLKARVPPHYVGLRCPAYQSRSRNNFGVIGMVPDEEHGKGIFCRAVLNVPFFWKQKLKRLVLGSYGLTKHGRSIEQMDDFPKGGIFLVNPERDPEFDKLTPYHDYNYVPLKVRLPRNYREFIQTLDGSVLVSKSAAEKLRYRKVAYVRIMNPVPELKNKFLLWTKEGIKEGGEVHFQEPLSIARIGKQELAVNTSPVEGYVESYTLLTPNVPDERKVYEVVLVGDRPAELGTKLESATGLKNTIGGFVDDREPVIVINPDTLKDRALYWEIKETGKAHIYITISGKDGNISNKNARLSNTLIQGIFMFPKKVRKKLIKELFTPENVILNAPENILDILENFDVNPKKYPIFYPQMYYIRDIKKWRVHYTDGDKEKTRLFTSKDKAVKFAKEVNGSIEEKVYPNEQLSQFGRAVEALYKKLKEISHVPLSALPAPVRRKLIDKAYDQLPSIYKLALDNWVRSWASRLIIGDPGKSTQIKLRGWMRIILFDSKVRVNEIAMSEKLWETMGKPEYVIWYKEPVSRPESIRCLKVKIDKELKDHPQVVRIHPAIGMNYDDGTMRAKVDSVMPYTPILVRRNGNIELTTFEKLFNEYSNYIRPDGKEESLTPDLEILSKHGWDKAVRIIRHKTHKKIYAVTSLTGRVDVTEDHSIIIDNTPTKPKEIIPHTTSLESLDISLPETENIPIDLAWLYGLFVAEGHAKIYLRKNSGRKGDWRYEFHISNKDKKLLERARKVLEKYWPDYRFEIKKYNSDATYKLIVYGYRRGTKRDFVLWWNKNFYINHEKAIPSFLLKAKLSALGAFLAGYIQGDGHIYKNEHGKIILTTKSHVVAWFLTYILKRLGYTYRINSRPDKPQIIQISTVPLKGNSNRYIENRNTVNKVFSFDYDGYVYDIETETGTFYAGVGNIHLHNTDGDLAVLIPIKNCIKELQYSFNKEEYKSAKGALKKYGKFEDLPEPEYDYSCEELAKELTCYNRYLTQEAQVIEWFGGLKNRAMYTDIIKDHKKWLEFTKEWDIELKAMQADKYMEGFKEMDYCQKAEVLRRFLSEARSTMAKLPPRDSFAEEWLKLSSSIGFKERYKIRQMIKALKKQKHPILQLYWYIYQNSPLKV